MNLDRHASATIDWLDETALATERKWGIGRLPQLVTPDLAMRFRAQQDRLNEALVSGRNDAIKVQAEAMERAWKALDAAASAAGAKPLSPTVWETVLPSTGEAVAIVRTAEEASAIARDRNGAVYTLAEIALALDAFGEQLRATKAAFPGAEVKAVRSRELSIGSASQNSRANGRARSRTRQAPAGDFSNLFHAPLDPPPSPSPDGRPFDDEIPF